MYKKILITLVSILTVPTLIYAQTVFRSSQVGANPVTGYFLKTDCSVTPCTSIWAAVTGGGGGTGVGWLWNSINSLYQSTTTDDVLLGASATTSTAKLEVIAGGTKPSAYFKGNVGIGTTSPYAMLSVAGEVVAEKFTSTSTTATSTLRGGLNVQSYYLGVGTSTSGFTQGINIPDQTKITAITTGIETGWDYGLLNWNMFIGTGGQRNTIDHTIAQPDPLYPANGINGLYNTFVGMGAGDDNTVGNLNTFLGSLAGTANTTGGQNTFLGAVAGFSNTTGIHNTYVGVGAGESNIAGNHNVAVGTDALLSATNTLSSIAIGSGAGASDNGQYNISIGESTLAVGNWGHSLVAISPGALQNNSFGSKSIGIGRSALFYATSSDNNIAIGYSAGKSTPQAGNDNIFIGSDTYSAPGVYNSIAIGTSTYLGESNLIVLGNANVNKTYIGGIGGAGTVYVPTLQVSQTATISNLGSGNSLTIEDSNSDLTPTVFNASGDIGIGTSNPTLGKVQITSTSGGATVVPLVLENKDSTIGGAIRMIMGVSADISANANGRTDLLTTRQSDGSMDLNFLLSPGGVAPTSRLYLDGSSGNIGVSSTTPFGKLSVASFDNGTQPQFVIASSTGSSATSTSFIVNQFGNVGIGTANPSRLLHLNASSIASTREGLFKGSVSDAGNDSFYIGNGTAADGRFAPAFQSYVDSNNTTYSQGFWGMTSAANDASDSSTFGLTHIAGMRTSSASDPTNGTLSDIVNRKIFTVGGATTNIFMTVAAGGNVGIGETAPATKLHVSDGVALHANIVSALSTSQFVSSKSGSGANASTLFTAGANATDRGVFYMMRSRGTASSPTIVSDNDQVGDLLFGGYDGSTLQNTGGVFAYVDGTPSAGVVPMRISFVTGQTNSASRAERLTVKASGNVGVGTTSPYAKLSVVGLTASEYFTATSTSIASRFPYASTTAITSSYASSTSWFGGGLQTCDPTTGKLTWSSGVFGCGTDGGGGGGEVNTASSRGTGLNIFDSKSGVDLRFNTIAAGTNITLSTTSDSNTIVVNSSASGGSVGGYSELATSTSMSIDICSTSYATSSTNVLKKLSSNITVTMSGSACLGKFIYIDDVAPLTGVIGTTTYSGVYWNGQTNPGSGTVNGITDRFKFTVTASTTSYIQAKLDSTY